LPDCFSPVPTFTPRGGFVQLNRLTASFQSNVLSQLDNNFAYIPIRRRSIHRRLSFSRLDASKMIRLLQYKSEGGLSLTTFLGDNTTPRYAIRCAAARDELVRAHWFSLNSGQSEGLIPLAIASISTSLYGIHQNNHDFYIGGHRIACTHRSYLSYSSLAPD